MIRKEIHVGELAKNPDALTEVMTPTGHSQSIYGTNYEHFCRGN
ncbi:hypothetical protein Xentx_00923 [Xenorhabdus thuongxuanensis]|uniref:Uncharacterized protein n=1 Tax=Xenorhabdus thuongxuanensis TaxID=1873484 RepID=A0A1Q5U6W3_9GAMM|nr:hypothetical protein Xentx_00923 [Xenorhabdus thuongxuanensis]